MRPRKTGYARLLARRGINEGDTHTQMLDLNRSKIMIIPYIRKTFQHFSKLETFLNKNVRNMTIKLSIKE